MKKSKSTVALFANYEIEVCFWNICKVHILLGTEVCPKLLESFSDLSTWIQKVLYYIKQLL